MKIALLHLDVAEGPETRNRKSIISAAGEAVSRGADWIVTPETALQGYFFHDNNGKLPSFSEKQLSRYLLFAGRNKADMFLSAAEYDERDGKGYNSCFVINREGEFLGKHRKMFSHRKGFERWLSLGREIHVFNIGTLRVGLLVCADSYYEQPCLEIKRRKRIWYLLQRPGRRENAAPILCLSGKPVQNYAVFRSLSATRRDIMKEWI